MGDPRLDENDDSRSGRFEGTERFHVRRHVGEGAFGVVYEAHDTQHDATVALKVLRQVEGAALYRFKQEFRRLADLSHANLVTLHELHSDGDRWFFAMEFVDGVDLLTYVRGVASAAGSTGTGALTIAPPSTPSGETQSGTDSSPPASLSDAALSGSLGGSLSEPATLSGGLSGEVHRAQRSAGAPAHEERLRGTLSQLASALEALHAAGLLHRDVKPSNVMVSREGRVVLLDFGLVTDNVEEPGSTADSRIVGTPQYMAPEQASGESQSEATDWYAVGVMLFEALSGQLPFDGPPSSIVSRKLLEDAPDVRSLNASAPADLADLCAALLLRDPSLRPSGAAVLSTLKTHAPKARRERRRAELFGRDTQRESLWSALERTRTQGAEVVVLRGRSGTGKSSLLKRFLDELRAKSPETIVLSGVCHEQESVPFKAFDPLIDALTQQLRALPRELRASMLPADVSALARLFPVLSRVSEVRSAARVDVPDAHALREKAAAVLCELFARLSAHAPLVLCVDNLHWGDADSAPLFDALLRNAKSQRVLLVATYRTEEGDPTTLLDWLTRAEGSSARWPVQIVDIAELEESDAISLALHLIGDESDQSRTRAAFIARESRGNPYFLDVLARHAELSEQRQQQEDTRLALDEALWVQAEQLDPAARRTLEVLAVAGAPLPLSVLRAAAELDHDALTSVSILRAQRLVRARGTRGSVETLSCAHDRVREAVYARIPDDVRALRHRRLAESLERVKDTEPDTLALHFEQGSERQKAALYAERAADRASAALAFERAASLYQRALSLLDRPSAEKRRALYEALGDALSNAGRGSDAAAAYLLACEGAPALEALSLRLRAADPLLRSGHIDEGLEQLKTVLRALGLSLSASPQRALVSLLAHRAKIAIRGEKYTLRTDASPRELLKVDACRAAAQGLALVDNIHGAEFNTRHYIMALDLGDPYRAARATALEIGFSSTSGWPARKRTAMLVERGMQEALRCDNPHAEGIVRFTTGVAGCLEGRFREGADACARAAHVLRERCVSPWDLAQAAFYELSCLAWLGSARKISEAMPTLIERYEARGDLMASTSIRTYLLYREALAANDPARGREDLRASIARWSQRGWHVQHWWAVKAEADCDLYEGRPERSLAALDANWKPLSDSMLLRVQYARVEALHHRVRSLLRVADRDRSALGRAEGDVRKLEREDAPWSRALGTLYRGSLYALHGERAKAAATMTTAIGALDRLELHSHAASARIRCGELLGGSAGATLAAKGESALRSEGVVDVERYARALVP